MCAHVCTTVALYTCWVLTQLHCSYSRGEFRCFLLLQPPVLLAMMAIALKICTATRQCSPRVPCLHQRQIQAHLWQTACQASPLLVPQVSSLDNYMYTAYLIARIVCYTHKLKWDMQWGCFTLSHDMHTVHGSVRTAMHACHFLPSPPFSSYVILIMPFTLLWCIVIKSYPFV